MHESSGSGSSVFQRFTPATRTHRWASLAKVVSGGSGGGGGGGGGSGWGEELNLSLASHFLCLLGSVGDIQRNVKNAPTHATLVSGVSDACRVWIRMNVEEVNSNNTFFSSLFPFFSSLLFFCLRLNTPLLLSSSSSTPITTSTTTTTAGGDET